MPFVWRNNKARSKEESDEKTEKIIVKNEKKQQNYLKQKQTLLHFLAIKTTQSYVKITNLCPIRCTNSPQSTPYKNHRKVLQNHSKAIYPQRQARRDTFEIQN